MVDITFGGFDNENKLTDTLTKTTASREDWLLAQVDRLDSNRPFTEDDLPEAAAMRLYTDNVLTKKDKAEIVSIIKRLKDAKDSGRHYIAVQNNLSGKTRATLLNKGYKIEVADREGTELSIKW